MSSFSILVSNLEFQSFCRAGEAPAATLSLALSPGARQESGLGRRCQKLVDGLLRHGTINRRQRVANLARRSRAVRDIQRLVRVVASLAASSFELEESDLRDAVTTEVVFQIVVAEGFETSANRGIAPVDRTRWSRRARR